MNCKNVFTCLNIVVDTIYPLFTPGVKSFLKYPKWGVQGFIFW